MFGLLRGLKDRDIADNCGNLKMLLSEAAYSKGKPNKIKTSIYKLNFSYTHDYKWYAEKSGIETVVRMFSGYFNSMKRYLIKVN